MTDNKKFLAALATALLVTFTGTVASAAEHGILSQLRCDPKFADQAFYDPAAVHLHQSGAVLVEFSVNAKGRAERPVVIQATAPEVLQSAALRVARNFKCKPGKDWAETGGPEQRVRLNVLFHFKDEGVPKLIDEAAEVVTVVHLLRRH